jgi:thiol:disulfide interchange protein
MNKPLSLAIVITSLLQMPLSAQTDSGSAPAPTLRQETQARSSSKNRVIWHKSLKKGQKLARQQKKPLLVIAGASWCPDCRRMDQSILPDEAVQKFLQANYVNVHLDSESGEGQALMQQHETKVIPQVFVFAANGEFLSHAPAEHVTPETFKQLVLDLSKPQTGTKSDPPAVP